MRFIGIFATVLLLAAPLAAQEGPAGGPGHITVTGEGRVETSPDMATVTMGATSEADTAAAALRANSEQVAAVLEWLRGAGIEERDIQTSGLSLSPRYDNRVLGSYGQPQITGFFASNTVTVRVRDLDGLGVLLDTVVEKGANAFNGLSFGLQDPAPTLDEARRRAVADARHRAELYAEAAGVTLGAVESIAEQSFYQPPGPMMMREAAMSADAGVPVAAGEVSVQANVTIVYRIAE